MHLRRRLRCHDRAQRRGKAVPDATVTDALLEAADSIVVVKNFETNYRRVPRIAGATILGNGAVALIVDVAHLVRRPHP